MWLGFSPRAGRGAKLEDLTLMLSGTLVRMMLGSGCWGWDRSSGLPKGEWVGKIEGERESGPGLRPRPVRFLDGGVCRHFRCQRCCRSLRCRVVCAVGQVWCRKCCTPLPRKYRGFDDVTLLPRQDYG